MLWPSIVARPPAIGPTLEDRIAGGHADAIVEAYRAHHAHVRAFAERLVGDRMAAEDLVHEVFVTLPDAMRRFEGQCSLRTWLIAIAARRAQTHVRAAQRRRRAEGRLAYEPPASPPRPDQVAERAELASLLTRALDALPLEQRVAFVLCEVEERTSVEVAQMLDVGDGTVRARVHLAKKKLRVELERLAPRREGGAMTDDLLARATRALRDETAPSSERKSVESRARLERSLRTRPASRARARWLVWPLAATFLVLTAWAGASGQLGRLAKLVAHEDVEEHAPARSMPSEMPTASPVATDATAAMVPTIAPSTELLPLLPEPTPPAPALPAAKAVDVDALYREAHEAHFVRRDADAALRAWDRYLAASGPNGKFVIEARYNRALSLVRLGRKSEAVTALRPFANGDYGGYRRDEAAQLLTTLE